VKEIIKGKAYVLGDDIDTDQIIPAHHLVYNLDDKKERKLYGKYAFSGVPIENSGLPDGNIPFIKEGEFQSEYAIVIGGKNFGCGSSREHAPVALQMANIKVVVAFSYARIFYRNSIDGGYIIPYESKENLSSKIRTGDSIEINCIHNTLTVISTGKTYNLNKLGEVAEIVNAGGIFEYAKKSGMLK
jgi:3-isopropylmalate/(R)-2-methylmalate dehydratase small subunit